MKKHLLNLVLVDDNEDDLILIGSLVQLHEHFHPTHLKSSQPQYNNFGKQMKFNQTNPNYGGDSFGRETGWTINSVNAAYALADLNWRAQTKPWFDDVVTILQDSVMCTGRWSAKFNAGKLFPDKRGSQTYEEHIMQNALVGTLDTVFKGVDPANAQKIDAMVPVEAVILGGDERVDDMRRDLI